MGCFTYTCALSRLPIEAGDPVRVLLVSSCPFDYEAKWLVRSFPIKATYDDYGAFEPAEGEKGFKNWMDVFQLDLIERGTGDNTCHDVEVKKTASFHAMVNALREKRVLVNNKAKYYRWGDLDEKVAKLIGKKAKETKPLTTLEHVISTIRNSGFDVHEGQEYPGEDRIIVDEPNYSGCIRVYAGMDFKDKTQKAKISKLEEIAKLFPDMSTAISAATERQGAELNIRPKVGSGQHCLSVEGNNAISQVRYLMVREDVWQNLLKIRVNYPDCNHKQYCNCIRGPSDVAKRVKASVAALKSNTEDRIDRMITEDKLRLSLPALSTFSIYGLLTGTHFEVAAQNGEDTEEFHQIVAELLHVMEVARKARIPWDPDVVDLGSQQADWGVAIKVLDAFKKAALVGLKRSEENGY